MAKFKTDFKDEVVDSRTRQILDAGTGAVIHNNVLVKNTYTPKQAGDKVGATWVNSVGQTLNELQDDSEDLYKNLYHDNLLINPSFTIWQRGTTFSTACNGDYIADRWRMYIEGASTNTVNARQVGGHLLVTGKNQARYVVHQFIELTSGLKKTLSIHKKITVTVRLMITKDTNIGVSAVLSGGGDITGGSIQKQVKANTVTQISFTADVNTDADSQYIQINIEVPASSAQSTFTMYWAKVEFGSISTPFVERPYTIETLLCQRFYSKLGTVYFAQMAATQLTSQFYNALNGSVPVPMFTTPVISYDGIYRMEGVVINSVTPIFSGRITAIEGIRNLQLSGGLATNSNNSTIYLTNVSLDAEVR